MTHYVDRDLTHWRRRRRRPRLKPVARWLRQAAHWVYPEPLHTLQITVGDPPETTTFVDCRECKP